jgi:hypothetical protein
MLRIKSRSTRKRWVLTLSCMEQASSWILHSILEDQSFCPVALFFQRVMKCMGLATQGTEGLIVHMRQMTGIGSIWTKAADNPPEECYEWYVKPWHQDAELDQVGDCIISNLFQHPNENETSRCSECTSTSTPKFATSSVNKPQKNGSIFISTESCYRILKPRKSSTCLIGTQTETSCVHVSRPAGPATHTAYPRKGPTGPGAWSAGSGCRRQTKTAQPVTALSTGCRQQDEFDPNSCCRHVLWGFRGD